MTECVFSLFRVRLLTVRNMQKNRPWGAAQKLMCVCVFQRLQAKVLKLVDISYGGENGFNQAIELSAEVLSNVKFIQEKKLIGKWLC